MEKISLDEYDIYVGNFWETFNLLFEKIDYSRVAILVDENTRQFCLPKLLSKTKISDPLIIETKSGELNKNIQTCSDIWQQMIENQIDRNGLLINLGGGVIGDMGGFCASTYKRGIDFIQMPTTLLSQVDSSIGGKLGIDFGEVKNSIGLFQNPQAVFIDPDFLETLSPREIRSGFAEMIKHGLIKDETIWSKLKALENFENVDWISLITPSLNIKKEIVEEDPLEKSIRKKLNFGHTIGHAIESFALENNQSVLHGEAIAAGMVCEAWLSTKKCNLTEEALAILSDYILKTYSKLTIEESSFPQLLELMKNDKKNEGSTINFTLLTRIGASVINHSCEEELIQESLKYYMKL